ncbi:hypothetical protein BSPWISOXPB_9246 [uncultured Gammaproteobacteria bacterium]|nr:hypothetical protein BSPWISOXPB_9246 [uncultured Gammaproteobacteria bacterium]
MITLAVNAGSATFDITGGDADKFTLNGNKLTFKATALKDGNDATYRINIKATKVFDLHFPLFATDEQTLVVTSPTILITMGNFILPRLMLFLRPKTQTR